MAASCLEIRFPSQLLGMGADGGVWLRASRSAPVLERGGWSAVDDGADRLLRFAIDGNVAEELPGPRLVRAHEVGGRLVGFVGRATDDAVVGARQLSEELTFDLRGAREWCELGALVAFASGRYVVVEPREAGAPCPVWDAITSERIGAFAPRRTRQSFWAVDESRVYSCGATTSAWRRSGELLWNVPLHTSSSAGISSFEGDLWLVTQDDKGHDLLCVEGDSGRVLRRSSVPPVHSLVGTASGLLVGHELGVSLVKSRAGRPSSLLKARVDVAVTDGSGWAALDREARKLFLSRSLKSSATLLELAGAESSLGELELVAVSGGHAVLRPLAEVEDERTAMLLGDERLPRLGRRVVWVDLAQRGRSPSIMAARAVAELVDGAVRVRASTGTALGALARVPQLALTDAQVRLANALERYSLIPRGWRKKVEAELLRDEHAGALGALLQAAFAGAGDKGHRAGFASWERLRLRGGTGLVSDFERLLRDEPITVKQVELDDAGTSVVVARGRQLARHELGQTDDPVDLVRLINAELASSGSERRFHSLESPAPLRAFLLCNPAETQKMKRGGLKGLGKPVE